MSNLFAHYNQENGEVLGILNKEKYKRRVMPSPNIPISQHEADKICSSPLGFKVVNKKLTELPKPKEGLVTELDFTTLDKERHDAKIVGYVDKDKVCYLSDDAAVSHLSLSILANEANPKAKIKLYCMIDGKRCLHEVDKKKALFVSDKIYSIRTRADQKYFEGYNKLLSAQ